MTNAMEAQLRETYGAKDTEELVELRAKSTLTETAYKVLDEILAARNVTGEMAEAIRRKIKDEEWHEQLRFSKSIPAATTALRSNKPIAIDSATDLNPYQAPSSDLSDAPIVKDSSLSKTDISMSELIAFAGKKHYPERMMRLLQGQSSHAGFNFWATIFGIQWYFYRKLYLFGLFSAALEISVPLIFVWVIRATVNPAHREIAAITALVAFVLTRILIGYMANIAMCLKAEKVIKEIDNLNKDNETHLRMIAHAGGVSVPSLLFIYVVLAIIRFL
jgi:hypothetical protein